MERSSLESVCNASMISEKVPWEHKWLGETGGQRDADDNIRQEKTPGDCSPCSVHPMKLNTALATDKKAPFHYCFFLLFALTGHVKPKFIRMGLVKEFSGMALGTWKELDPSTGVTAPPYVHGGSGDALGW